MEHSLSLSSNLGQVIGRTDIDLYLIASNEEHAGGSDPGRQSAESGLHQAAGAEQRRGETMLDAFESRACFTDMPKPRCPRRR